MIRFYDEESITVDESSTAGHLLCDCPQAHRWPSNSPTTPSSATANTLVVPFVFSVVWSSCWSFQSPSPCRCSARSRPVARPPAPWATPSRCRCRELRPGPMASDGLKTGNQPFRPMEGVSTILPAGTRAKQ